MILDHVTYFEIRKQINKENRIYAFLKIHILIPQVWFLKFIVFHFIQFNVIIQRQLK